MKPTVLFDMDGVLVETEHLKANAHASTIQWFGGSVSKEIYADVMGQPHSGVRAAFIKAAGIPIDFETYSSIYRTRYHTLLETDLKETPGIQELLIALRSLGYQMGLVSSSSTETAKKILGRFNLESIFAVQVFSEDVNQGKPYPEPYLTALRMLNVKASDVVVIEDSQAGVDAAVQAGLNVIALRHLYNTSQDFTKATYILNSLQDTDAVIKIIEKILTKQQSNGG